jgi:uncharacterized membrane protein
MIISLILTTDSRQIRGPDVPSTYEANAPPAAVRAINEMHAAAASQPKRRSEMLNRVVTVAALAVGGVMLSKQMKKNRGSGASSSITETIEVNVPVRTAYNQWTQFEDFPQFMKSVYEVKQLDDKRVHFRANVAGEDKHWDAEITEQIPDKRIAWRSINGVPNGGVVTFHKISDNCTRIALQMDYEPEGPLEKLGDSLGAVRMEARSNLSNFKELLEKRGTETGGWRGKIDQH